MKDKKSHFGSSMKHALTGKTENVIGGMLFKDSFFTPATLQKIIVLKSI